MVVKTQTLRFTHTPNPRPAAQKTQQEAQAGSQIAPGKTQEKLNLDSKRSQPPRVRARLRDWKPQFLREFAKCGIITMAARAVGVDRGAVLYHRTRSHKFEAEFQKALATANDILEMHALQLATVGQSDPIFMRDAGNNPVMVFDRKRKSERLMELMLKSRLPQRFREQVSQEISGPGGQPLVPITPVNCTFVLPSNNRNDPAHRLKDAEVKELPPAEPEKT
jgi:hypothetical protein